MGSINLDTGIASCSNKWESTTLVTLGCTIIKIVKNIYTKIFIASILNTTANSMTSHLSASIQLRCFTWSVLKNESPQETAEQKPWVSILNWVNKNGKWNSKLIANEIIFIHRIQCDGKTIEVLVMPAKNKRGLTVPQVNKFWLSLWSLF